MCIVLLGAQGQVGWELRRALAPLGPVIALDRHGLRYQGASLCGDLSQPDALRAALQQLRPRVIVNAAAYTAVDKAESEPELAHVVNAQAPGVLAEVAAASAALLVHYSTDYVFDGSGDQARPEEAETGPLSVYGCTKLEGEELIRQSGCQHLIFRTSWVHAARGGNFARTMLRLAREREQLKVIDDQIGAPTGADLIADVSAHAIRALGRDSALSGTYHLVAAGEVSWHGYARHVIEWARSRGHDIRVAGDQILPIPTQAYPTPARRPLNSRLATWKLQQRLGLTLPDWRQGVDRMLSEVLG
jgi:dTDP-4-dehydrorhamnose reductase